MPTDFDRVYDRTASDSSKWHTYPPDVLPMYVADMDFRSPEPVVRALRERVEHGFFGYGKESPEFAEVVAARLARRYGWVVEPGDIITMPGVIASFNLAVRAFTNPGEGVLVHVPCYGPIAGAPGHHGAVRQEAALVPGPGGRYELDRESFASAIDERTRVFLHCSPHNPTGRVFTRDEQEWMARICLDRGLVVVSDEIHCDLVYPGSEHVPMAAVCPEVAANTVTLMAPSKTFNLPGLKASIAIVTDAGLRERFLAARAELVRVPSILGLTAMLAAYRDCDGWLEELLAYLAANREFVGEFVRCHLPGIGFSPPEGTYLAWLDCRGLAVPGSDPHAFFLEQAKVALGNGASFGAAGQGFVRLNFGCPRPLLAEGLERMRRAVAAL